MSDYVRRVTEPERPILSRLGHLDIELTERCDNDCIHCCINLPAADAHARARELTAKQWEGIISQAADLGCLQVRFTGGEPLLRGDFEELYLHTRRLGMKVLLFTNARQLGAGRARSGGRGEQLVDLLARVPPLVPIEVTVYGMHRESYEAVSRISGSYEQFRRGVDRLLDRGLPFVVKGVVLGPNRSEIDEFERWAQVIPAMDGPPDYALLLDLRNRRDDSNKNELIGSMRLPPDDVVALLTRDAKLYRRDKAEFAARFMGSPGAALFRCGAGRAVSVDAYGRAQPCLGVRAPGLTVDLLATSLGDTLDGFAALRHIHATNPEYLHRCAVCFLAGFCEQCPAKSWGEHGTLDTPVEYLCAVAHAQARYLGWLQEGERAWQVEEWRGRLRAAR